MSWTILNLGMGAGIAVLGVVGFGLNWWQTLIMVAAGGLWCALGEASLITTLLGLILGLCIVSWINNF